MGTQAVNTLFLIGVVVFGVGAVACIRELATLGLRPARLVVHNGSFIAPTTWGLRIYVIVPAFGTVFFGILLSYPIPPDPSDAAAYFGLIPMALFLAGLTVFLLARISLPALAISPVGFRLGVRSATWASLDAGERPKWFQQLMRQPKRQHLGMNASPQFVASIVEHYLDNPADRPLIGQPTEYERVVYAVSSTPAAVA